MKLHTLMLLLGKSLAVGGIAAAISYGLFVCLGKKWLENKFSERLEAYKHEQRKELENVRFHINTQLNRLTKIHDKEIEVLPNAWRELQIALTAARRYHPCGNTLIWIV